MFSGCHVFLSHAVLETYGFRLSSRRSYREGKRRKMWMTGVSGKWHAETYTVVCIPVKKGTGRGLGTQGQTTRMYCGTGESKGKAMLGFLPSNNAHNLPEPALLACPPPARWLLCRWTLRCNLVIYLIFLTVMNSGYTGFKFCILLTSCIRVFRRNGTNRISVSIWISAYLSVYPFNCQEIYFKELTCTLVRPGKFEICKPSWQPGDSGKSWRCSLESEGWERRQNFCCSLEAEFFLQETAVFALKAFTWLDKAHHIMEW